MQATIAKKIDISGVGLHSGKNFRLEMFPAVADTGIQIRRTDVANCNYTNLSPYNVSSTQLATTVNCGELPISTVEHFMASFYGLGIDNAYIDVSGAEVPILDGSASDIVDYLLEAGVIPQDKPRQILKVTRAITYSLGDKVIEIVPSDQGLDIEFTLDYEDSIIGCQIYKYHHNRLNFINDIAFARTFGFKREVDALWSMGLARGGSLDNAVLVGEDTVLNPDGLRSKDEFVRHKILDLLGDLSLIGYRLQGSIRAVKAGHNINNLFARTVLEASNSYEIIDEDDSIDTVNSIHILKDNEPNLPLNNYQDKS